MARFHSFSWLNNIPLYIYHIFLIHSSIDGHIGCVHTLAIVNNAAVNTGVHICFQVSFCSDIQPELEFDCMVVLILILWGSSILFFIVAAPIYIPTNNVQVFPFLHILANTYLLSFLIIANLFFFNLFYLFILAVLGLRCCSQAFSTCGERELLFVVVHWLLIAVASLVAVGSRGYSLLRCTGFSLQWLLLLQSTGSRAQAQ